MGREKYKGVFGIRKSIFRVKVWGGILSDDSFSFYVNILFL